MGGCLPVGLLRCVLSVSFGVCGFIFNPENAVVCRRDGLTVCASAARVVVRCFGCPIAYKVRFRLCFRVRFIGSAG